MAAIFDVSQKRVGLHISKKITYTLIISDCASYDEITFSFTQQNSGQQRQNR